MLNLKKLVQTGKKHKLLKIPVLAILLAAMTVVEGLRLMCAAFSRRSVRRMAAILTAVCVITVGLPMDSLAAVSSAGENGGAIQETQTEESSSAQQPSEESKAEEPKATASDSWNPDHSQIQGESDEESSQEEAFDPQEDTELIDDVNGAGQTESETNSQEVPGGGGYEKTDAMLAVTDMIDALPAAEELDGLNLGDEGFIDHINSLKADAAAAMAAYDALSQEEQENFPSEELDKLTALEAALEAVLPTVNLLTLPQMNGLTNGVVTIKINDGPEIGGDNLEAAIGATDLSTITSLEVTAGKVTSSDWVWFKTKKDSFTSLISFETAAGVKVASLPDGDLTTPMTPTVFPPSIVSVSMPELTGIGRGAFAGCHQLMTISFPRVATMGASAFAECTNLREANFPNFSSDLPKQAFYHCTALTDVNFPLVANLLDSAFEGCASLTAVSFPNVARIPWTAGSGGTFRDCASLKSVSMPKLGEMNYDTFDGCTGLAALKLPEYPPLINGGTFQDCPTPRTLTLVASDGTPLTGTALSEALGRYDSDTSNGNAAGDHLWYGWTLKDNTSGFVPKNGGVTLDKANNSIYANGNAITAIQGAYSGDTKLYYTDDPAQTIIDLDSMVDPDGLTGNTVDGYQMVWSSLSGRQTGIHLYGGSNSIPITGGASITIEGGYIEEVCGGGKGDDGTPASNVAVDSASIVMSGGTVNNMTGGGYKGNVTGDIKVTVTGGTVFSLTGGSTRAAVDGDVTINLTECRISLVSPGSSGKNVSPVSGTISLAVGGAAKIGGMLSGDGILVKNGFFFALTNSFTGSVVCNLPADYTGGTLITNVQVSDLNGIRLTGPGAEHAAKTHSGDKLVVTITQPGPSGDAEASWQISGGSGGSGTVEEAFTALQGKTGVITLLKDMANPTLGSDMPYPLTVMTSGNVTLDMNGKQVDHFQAGTQGQDATLTIKDSVGGGKLLQSDTNSALLTCAGGKLKVESGVFEGKSPKNGALHVISNTMPKPVVELSGGTFAGSAGNPAIEVVSVGEDPTFSWSKILAAGKKLDPDTVSHVTEGSLVTYSSASTVVVKDSGVAPPAPTGGELKAPLTQPNVDQVFGPGNATVNTSPNPPVITLNQDVVVDAPIVVKSPVKADINLNGHTITGKPGAAVNPVITVGSGADVTVTGPGSVTGGDGANSGNGGDGIKVESGGKLETGGGAVIEGGTGGTGNSGGNGITGGGDVIIGGGSSVTGGSGGNSGAGAGGDGGHGITGSGDVIIGGGSSVTGGTGGTSGAGTGGAGGNGANSSGSGNVVIDSGSVAGGAGGGSTAGTGGAGGNGASSSGTGGVVIHNGGNVTGGAGGGSTESAGGAGGTGASSQSGSVTVDTGASSSGGAGGSSSHGNGGAGGAGTGTATGEITVNSDSVTGGAGGTSDTGDGGKGGAGADSSQSGNVVIHNGGGVTGGAGGGSTGGTGGAGGNGANSQSGNVTVDTGASSSGGAGGGSTTGDGGTGGTGANSQSGSVTVNTGASSSGGAGGNSSGGTGGAGGAGTGTATGEITVNSDSVTGGTGGTSDTGNGGTGGAGADSSQSGNVVIHNGGGVTGGAGGGSTGGTGGSGGNGASSQSGNVTVDTGASSGGGAGGGSTAGAGGTGGTGANSQSGSVTVNTGASSSGGAGGNSAGGSGGAGGNGTSTGTGGTTTVGGETTGGQGGSGSGTGNGGDGGSGTVIDSGTTAAGSGTATGGDGGNVPEDGSSQPGQGGPGVQGGSPGSVKPIHGQNGVKVTATVEASQAGTTVTAAKQDLVNAVPITQEDIDHNREIKVELKVEKKDNQPDKDAVEAARPGNASTVGAYFDISLLKTVTESGTASPPETITATQPGSTISITITIPADMRGGSNYTVIRVHGGQGTSLPTSQSGNDLTFQTDQFSTYAIAYTPSGGGSGGGGSGSGGSGGGSGSGGSGGGGSSTDSGGNEYGSSTHSSGSGSSGPGVVNDYEPPFIVSGPTKENPNAPVTVQTNINTAADANGRLDINHLDAVLNAALNKAGTEASKGGNGIVVNVQFGAEALTADTVSINLPKSVQEKIIGEQLQAFQLISRNPALTLRFDLEAIKNIWQQANSDVRITITRLTSLAGLPEEFITEAGSRPVYRIGLVCDNGNRTLSTLSAGQLTVGIPYTPGQGESEDLLYAISVTPDNQTGYPANPDYNRIQKELVFNIPYLGVFGIGEGEAAKNRRKKTRHTVKAGDTLWALAKRYDCSVAALMEVNHIDNPKRLHVGQQLIIPS